MANQNFIVTGGLYFTVPILLMGIASVLLFAWLLIRKLNHQDLNRKYVDHLRSSFVTQDFPIYTVGVSGIVNKARIKFMEG